MSEPLPAGESWQSRANLEARRPCDLVRGMEGRETFALGGCREPSFETVVSHVRIRKCRLLVLVSSFGRHGASSRFHKVRVVSNDQIGQTSSMSSICLDRLHA